MTSPLYLLQSLSKHTTTIIIPRTKATMLLQISQLTNLSLCSFSSYSDYLTISSNENCIQG